MNKTTKTILLLTLCVVVLFAMYSFSKSKKIDTLVNIETKKPEVNSNTSYWGKINIGGTKYGSLNDPDKRVFDIFKSNLNEEYKQNGAITSLSTDSLSVLYVDANMMLISEASVTPCSSVKLIKKATQEILSKNCFVSEFVSSQYILSIDDNQGIVIYKAGDDKIIEIPNSILGYNSTSTYSSVDTYNGPDRIKTKASFEIRNNTLLVDIYKRSNNSFVKKVRFIID